MHDGPVVYRFGPFEFDSQTRALHRDQERVRLSAQKSAILLRLVAHAGKAVSKDALNEAAWPGQAISEISLGVAIHSLRKLLGSDSIETHPHHGYCFAIPVVRLARTPDRGPLDAQLEPLMALVQGRAQLDTLSREQIRQARPALEAYVRRHPDDARGHVLLAQVCSFEYEASATERERDTATLDLGIRHAERGCDLAPESGEAWSTFGFLVALKGDSVRAAAAALKAVTLEPDNWRNFLRLAKVTWGEERLRAAGRVLELNPGLALAHWMCATVFVARRAFEPALEHLRRGCIAQDAQVPGIAFPAVGLHLLHGLVLAATNRLDEAVVEFKAELSACSALLADQVYANVCVANTWYALGAVYARQRQRGDAIEAFEQALQVRPTHVPASAAMRGEVPPSATLAEAVIGHAIVLARGGRHEDAARIYAQGVAQAPPGHAGWGLSVEPMLQALTRPEIWEDALALVCARAL